MAKKTESETEYKYDVFLSHSSQDKDVVREIAKRLKKDKLRVWFDEWEIKAGDSIPAKIEEGLENSRILVLCMSANAFGSDWAQLESGTFRFRDPLNKNRRFIPLRLDDTDIPGSLAQFRYISWLPDDLTWRQLLTALGAPPEPPKPTEPVRDHWYLAHPYPMPPNFTGRLDERKMLSEWLETDNAHPLLSLRALGGFGKSALVWHWLMHDVEPTAWPRVVWWSFYESDASFNNFITKTLNYLSGGKIKPASPTRDDVEKLVGILHKPGTLLVLDGFERELRAFGGLNAAYQGDGAKAKENDRDCISPLAETFLRNVAALPNIQSKVLVTTRLCPRALEARGGGLLQGCREEELLQMQPADAVKYFHAQGIRGTHTEIEAACEPYGYHPLSLNLLAGLIVGDLEQPGDIAVAKKLDVAEDLVARQHHVLEVAYDSLTPERRELLSRIACFRSPMTFDALKALAETAGEPFKTLESDLRDLVARGLLHHDTKKRRFDLHPIVRRYAYDRLAAPDRADAHAQLRDYFAAVPPKDKVTCLEDLTPVVELYHHTVRAGQFDEARTLYRDRLHPLYYQLGAYQLGIDLLGALFPDGEENPPRLRSESDQGWTLNELGNSYSLSGQPNRAMPLFQQFIAISELLGDKGNFAVGLANLATMAQVYIGALRDAGANLRRFITLCREINHEFSEAVGHEELGRLLAYRGAYAESEEVHQKGIELARKHGYHQVECVTVAYSAHRSLLRGNTKSALAQAKRAGELAEIPFPGIGKLPRDYILAHWLLGAAHRIAGQHEDAERHLYDAFKRCRGINLVALEANILIDLARLRAATGRPDEARRLANEALLITERCGYVMQGADAHLELAKLALASGDKTTALDHARHARTLATCDGPPDYTYHAAYTEAGVLLKELGDASTPLSMR